MKLEKRSGLSAVILASTILVSALALLPSKAFAQTSAGRLTANLEIPKGKKMKAGLHLLGLSTPRDGYIYVPASYRSSRPTPLVLFFHGNNGDRDRSLELFRAQADREGFILVLPESRKRTWDRIIDRNFGADLLIVDQALKLAFSSLNIDEDRVAVAGFSDGASYALAVGLTNGDLFTHVAAFSPGSSRPGTLTGKPEVFIIHGVQDDVLPIDKCSREISSALKTEGYRVDYHEFEGMHLVTEEGKELFANWFKN